MRKKQLLLFFSVNAFVFSLLPFIMGAQNLTYPLIENPYFPFGNLLAAVGFVSLPCMFFFGIPSLYYPVSKKEKLFSSILKGLIFLNATWIPIGFAFTGNLSTSFSGDAIGFQGGQMARQIFLAYNYGLVLLPIGLYIVHIITNLIKIQPITKEGLMHPDEATYIILGIESGLLAFTIAPGYYWDGRKTVSFEILCKGYTINIFVDAGELDYIDKIKAPDGRYGGYDNWLVREDYIEPLERLSDQQLHNLILKFEQKQST